MWKTGIHWQTIDNISVIVQLGENSKYIAVLMRSQEVSLEFMKLRSDIVNKVRKATKELCPVVTTSESIIHPSEITTYHLPPLSKLNDCSFSLKNLAESIVKCKETVLNLSEFMSISELLKVEVYAGLGENLLQAFFNETQSMFSEKLSDDFLNVLFSKWKQQPDLIAKCISAFSTKCNNSQQTLRNRFLAAIKLWKENTEGTYKRFRMVLDELSVFAGKSPLVSIILLLSDRAMSVTHSMHIHSLWYIYILHV